jgi:hypothetical protein
VPPAKPQITLRRPGVPAHVADAFVAGGDAVTAAIPSTVETPAATPAAEGQGSGSAAAASGGHLALVSESRPDVQVPGSSDVRTLHAGIVQRRSGRARRRTTVYFDPQLARRLKVYCATYGVELSELVEKAVRAHLDGGSTTGTTSP